MKLSPLLEYIAMNAVENLQETTFDIALDMDSNYFINVKLLEKTTIPEFKHSYKKINNFFREIYVLLKNTASVNDRTFNEAKKKFNFPEKIKIGLGYSKGTTGTGLTGKAALKVLKDAKEILLIIIFCSC